MTWDYECLRCSDVVQSSWVPEGWCYFDMHEPCIRPRVEVNGLLCDSCVKAVKRFVEASGGIEPPHHQLGHGETVQSEHD